MLDFEVGFDEMVWEISRMAIKKYIQDGAPLAMININIIAKDAAKMAKSIQLAAMEHDCEQQIAECKNCGKSPIQEVDEDFDFVTAVREMNDGKIVHCLGTHGGFQFKYFRKSSTGQYIMSDDIKFLSGHFIPHFSDQEILSRWKNVNTQSK